MPELCNVAIALLLYNVHIDLINAIKCSLPVLTCLISSQFYMTSFSFSFVLETYFPNVLYVVLKIWKAEFKKGSETFWP